MTGCASEPSDPSQPGTGARGTPLAAFAAYLLLACAAAWPLSGSPRSLLPGDPSGDTGVYVWNLWIFGHQLLAHAASPLYTSHILFPGPPIDLALHNYTIFQNAVGLVLVPWLGLVGAFNVTWLIMQAFSGFGVFLLARRCTPRPAVAWLAGALFAWSPRPGLVPTGMVVRAQETAARLLAQVTHPCLLHGDIQHHNLLRRSSGEWAIIDPKGVYGAPGFDIAAWMYNPPGVQDREDYRELAARRIAVCAEVWGIGQQELAAWAFAGTVLNACWSASGPAPAEWLVATLRVAEWLETLLD